MILSLLEWGTVGLTAVMAVVVGYAVTVTALYPTAWCNRVVAPVIPDDEFIVHGDDIVGLY